LAGEVECVEAFDLRKARQPDAALDVTLLQGAFARRV